MSLCPVSLLALEQDLEAFGEKYFMYTELKFYLDQANCLASISSIDENIDVLLGKQLEKDKGCQKIFIDENFGYVTVKC